MKGILAASVDAQFYEKMRKCSSAAEYNDHERVGHDIELRAKMS